MSPLETHNQVQANMANIYRTHRSNDNKTVQHLDMVERKQDIIKQKNIDVAIDDLKLGNYVKGTIINMLA